MKYVKYIVIMMYKDHRDSRKISIEKPKNEKKRNNGIERQRKKKRNNEQSWYVRKVGEHIVVYLFSFSRFSRLGQVEEESRM